MRDVQGGNSDCCADPGLYIYSSLLPHVHKQFTKVTLSWTTKKQLVCQSDLDFKTVDALHIGGIWNTNMRNNL